MRLTIAFHGACALGVLSSSATMGFVVPSTRQRHVRGSVIDMVSHRGWDNDDFMSALSAGSDALEDANQSYRDQSRHKPSSRSNDDNEEGEEEGQGGSRFKEMMRLAQDRQAQSRATPPQYTPYQEPPPVPQMPADFDNMSVEEQARMFRELMANPQQPPPPAAHPPPRQMPGGVDETGRKVGRNKDADTIANTSDLYFAQLKRDSTARTIARYTGDEDTANAIFEHGSVKEIEDQLQKNPYLTEQQERLRTFVEGTSEDEMLVVVPEETKTDKPKPYAGVSFRKKFAEAKKKSKGEKVQKEEPKAAVTPVEAPEKPVAPPKPEPVAEVAPPKPEPVAEAAPPKPEPVAEVAPPKPVTRVTPPAPPVVASSPLAVDAAGQTSEETRRSIRTLMGLLLKHRGGPGFGAGRLRAGEFERFEQQLAHVTTMLQKEADMYPNFESDAAAAAVPEPVATQPVVPEPVATQPAAAATPPASFSDPLAGTIACVEGAVAVYKSSSSDVEREGNMVSLRAALMAAVNSCNKVIAENELKNKQAYEALMGGATTTSPPPVAEAPTAPQPTMGFPDTYKVAKPEETEVATPEPAAFVETPPAVETPAATAADEVDESSGNTELLQKLYDNLQASGGNAKLGLKDGLTPEEASSLGDQLVEMRRVLMEELETGVPEAPPAPVQEPEAEPAAPTSTTSSSSSKSTVSKYKQMLMKSKASQADLAGL